MIKIYTTNGGYEKQTGIKKGLSSLVNEKSEKITVQELGTLYNREIKLYDIMIKIFDFKNEIDPVEIYTEYYKRITNHYIDIDTLYIEISFFQNDIFIKKEIINQMKITDKKLLRGIKLNKLISKTQY